MRRFAVLILACSLTTACGLVPTSGLGKASSNTMKAKEVYIGSRDGYQQIFEFLDDRFTNKRADQYERYNIRFYPTFKDGLRYTAEASASLDPIANEDGRVSAYDLALMIANDKLQIENSNPTDPKDHTYAFWLNVTSDSGDTDTYDLIRQQRDYYATHPRNGWTDLNKVAMLDKRLIELAYASAQNGDSECSRLIEMRTYYTAFYADPKNKDNKAPNDGKDFAYHHGQVLLIGKNILDVGSANKDFNVLTELRDFFEQSPNGVFPNQSERLQKINEVNAVILRLFGFEGLERSRHGLK